MNPVTTLTILAEMKIFETLVPLPVAIKLLKLWASEKMEFSQESRAGRRKRLKEA